MNERELSAWRETYRGLQGEGGDDCPGDERLAALAIGELESPTRDELADHMVACRRCSGRYRDLASLHEANASPERKTRSGSGRRWLGIAALLVIGVALALVVRQFDTDGDNGGALRGTATIGAAVEPANRAELTTTPSIISWQPIPGAESYQLLLFDREGGSIWQSEESDTPAAELPEAIRGRITPLCTYLWRIRYVAGLERLETDTRRFTIVP